MRCGIDGGAPLMTAPSALAHMQDIVALDLLDQVPGISIPTVGRVDHRFELGRTSD